MRAHDEAGESAPDPLVVVCDADAMSTRFLARVLEPAGFRVVGCATAAACEHIVQSQSPRLAILAVLLPDVDGLALTRRLRAAGASAPLLIVSALQAEERAIEAGADAFLRKPVAPQRLLRTIHRLLVKESGS